MQTNPAVEQSKIIRWSESPWSQSGRKGKGGGKDLLRSQVLSSEWNTERGTREDTSGYSEDGEDDELPCVMGAAPGQDEGTTVLQIDVYSH